MSIPMSEQIAMIIERMIQENGGHLELQRNKLANTVGCVPSQINYVITSRFNTDRGYIVESRRGGGGYVKITKVSFDSKNSFLMHMMTAVGNEIDAMSAKAFLVSLYDNSIITQRELKSMASIISDNVISITNPQIRDAIRANILKSFILTLRD